MYGDGVTYWMDAAPLQPLKEKWEYFICTLSGNDLVRAKDYFNELGQESWELTEVIIRGEFFHPIFKRRVYTAD